MEGNAIVSELLSPYNYKQWSVQVKTYLLKEDLWDIVEADEPDYTTLDQTEINAWRKKNAAALHAIQISCGPKAFRVIEEISSAKTAWTTLEIYHGLKSETENSEPVAEMYETDNVSDEFLQHEPLFMAVYRGDWDAAKLFLEQNPAGVRVRTPGLGKTALQVAVTEGHLHIVRRLVELMGAEDLEIVREDGFTALAAAIEVGNLPIAKFLIRKNHRLISINHYAYGIPVVHAVAAGQKHMIRYLYYATPFEEIMREDRRRVASLLSESIFLQHFDVALHLLERAPHLTITYVVPGRSPVCALAHSKVFPSGCSLNFWQQWIYRCMHIPDSSTNHIFIDIADSQKYEKKYTFWMVVGFMEVLVFLLLQGWSYLLKLLDTEGIYKKKLFHVQSLELLKRMCNVVECIPDETIISNAGICDALIAASYAGNVEFIVHMAKANPSLVWKPYVARRVFGVAVEYRQAKIFSLIYGLRDKIPIVSYRDENNSNMLDKATAVAPTRVLKRIPGAALQMQSELQWFKAVEEISPNYRDWMSKEFLEQRALFTENHKDLVAEGEKWMKDMANSSSLVGALIVTVTFAAAFTFPGGYEQTLGFPVFLTDKLFKVFMMSNAVALFTSTTSVLMFMGILTSRFKEEDFLRSLPKKLIIGLSTLFLSIAAMIIAFVAGLSLIFRQQLWIIVPSICLACIPISFFVLMQFPLLVDIFISTYRPIFNKNVKRWI